ncbi:Group 4 capsule protein B homolog [Edwardsiella tarda]|nr:YjbF family lipoprotein [Edwardsiella tarda]STD29066.1 Group 4 capsule protein B homolog [Edwardsiella tarda]
MPLIRNLLLISVMALSACSNTASITGETLKYALIGPGDVTVSATQVTQLPYASAYLKIGDNPRAFVVLAYVNGDELSWLTADNVMIVTRHGRIIKTVGLENDLVLNAEKSADPLAQPARAVAEWQMLAEWQSRYVSGYRLNGQLTRQTSETLDLVTRRLVSERFDEYVTTTPDIGSWHNQFWRDPQSGQIVKTRQQLGPDMPIIELTILKPFSS